MEALLRQKIEGIIRRGHGQCDPDAPHDPESVLFWCHKKGEVTNLAKVSKSQQLHTRGAASEAFVDEMAGHSVIPAAALAVHSGGKPAGQGGHSADQLLQGYRALAAAGLCFACAEPIKVREVKVALGGCIYVFLF